MQSFRTTLPPLPGLPQIQPDDHLLCLGSCFAQEIGDRFFQGRWSVRLNPFGTLYHPFPMTAGLLRLLEGQPFTAKDLFYHQEQWHSFAHHGQANCHKLPGQNFNKKLFTPDTIYKNIAPVLKRIMAQFPTIKILLTVSPIRHLRDGLITNQRSKASLLLACAELEKNFASIHYFPAYEILLDDLRDYRFYKND